MKNKKILLFSHNYISNNWYSIVSEQLNLIITSGLYDQATGIFCFCYCEKDSDFLVFLDLIRERDLKKKITIINHPINDNERQSLILMQHICKSYPDSYLLYYHTKGVTTKQRNENVNDINVTSWRKLMEFFNIENWQKCIEKLSNGNDVCGVLYGYWTSSHHQGNYYAGNFWWANSDYFNALPKMENRDNRMGCETLITSIPHRWHSFYSISTNLYEHYFDPNEYKNFFINL